MEQRSSAGDFFARFVSLSTAGQLEEVESIRAQAERDPSIASVLIIPFGFPLLDSQVRRAIVHAVADLGLPAMRAIGAVGAGDPVLTDARRSLFVALGEMSADILVDALDDPALIGEATRALNSLTGKRFVFGNSSPEKWRRWFRDAGNRPGC